MAMEFLELITERAGESLKAPDFVLLFLIMIVWPVYSYVNLKRHPVEKLRDDPNIRLSSYNETLVKLWGLTIAIILAWIWARRPFEALGFQHESGWQTNIAWIIAALGILFSAVNLFQVYVSKKAREKIAAQLRDVGELTQLLMPQTNKEYRRSMLLGITAGITEEIIFRGYLIWALGLFFPVWVAGALSVGFFVFLHRYQEKAGLIQVAAFATVATVMYIASGSLWPVIIMHVFIDILNISLARRVYKDVSF